ncbi:MAG: MFS transporter, partial [Bacteroidales bacterium]|nr:MFS transporter [Bacteroidales bacterium]
MMLNKTENKGWLVTFAGLSINLALGILYAWSVLKEAIIQSINSGGEGAFNWKQASLNDPYALCVLTFAFSMILAGKIQDVKGPSYTARIGGLLVGAGFILASLSTNYVMWLLGFGLLGGMGIGFGYSAATPAAIKWFSSAKTGLIAGMVVSGFGLAPVYIAPLSSFLVNSYGLQNTMMIYGISFIIFVCGLSFLLKNPPSGYVPQDNAANIQQNTAATEKPRDYSASEMLKTTKFYIMWIIFFIGSGAGLMIISNISGMAKASLGKSAFVAVAIMAVGNASGRIVAGMVSDKISRPVTLFLVFLFQAALMFTSYFILDKSVSAITIVLLATFIGF